MPFLNYDDIFACFRLKIEDYKLLRMHSQDQRDLLMMWLRAAASDPYLHHLFDGLEANEDMEQLRFTLKSGIPALSDDFTAGLLADGMGIQWLEPQICSCLNTRQLAESRREKFAPQPVLLSELRGLKRDLVDAYRKKIIDCTAFRFRGETQ